MYYKNDINHTFICAGSFIYINSKYSLLHLIHILWAFQRFWQNLREYEIFAFYVL